MSQKYYIFIFLIFTTISTCLGFNSNEYELKVLDKIHIIQFSSCELHLTDTINLQGNIELLDKTISLKGKTIFQAGNEILSELQKHYRVTYQGFVLVVFSKSSNYQKKYLVDGFEIRKKLIPFDLLNQEFQLSDSIFEVGKIYRNYKIEFDSDFHFLDYSKKELNKLSIFLNSHSSLNIEIRVFIDPKYLGLQTIDIPLLKAETIKQFLIKNGIEESRLNVNNSGNRNPLVSYSNLEKNIQKNNRFEFKITKIENIN